MSEDYQSVLDHTNNPTTVELWDVYTNIMYIVCWENIPSSLFNFLGLLVARHCG